MLGVTKGGQHTPFVIPSVAKRSRADPRCAPRVPVSSWERKPTRLKERVEAHEGPRLALASLGRSDLGSNLVKRGLDRFAVLLDVF